MRSRAESCEEEAKEILYLRLPSNEEATSGSKSQVLQGGGQGKLQSSTMQRIRRSKLSNLFGYNDFRHLSAGSRNKLARQEVNDSDVKINRPTRVEEK